MSLFNVHTGKSIFVTNAFVNKSLIPTDGQMLRNQDMIKTLDTWTVVAGKLSQPKNYLRLCNQLRTVDATQTGLETYNAIISLASCICTIYLYICTISTWCGVDQISIYTTVSIVTI